MKTILKDLGTMTQKIDATGLICPEPIMLLHRAIHEANPGEIVELVATDPTSEKDVEKFCEYLNHELISKEISAEILKFKVKKNSET